MIGLNPEEHRILYKLVERALDPARMTDDPPGIPIENEKALRRIREKLADLAGIATKKNPKPVPVGTKAPLSEDEKLVARLTLIEDRLTPKELGLIDTLSKQKTWMSDAQRIWAQDIDRAKGSGR